MRIKSLFDCSCISLSLGLAWAGVLMGLTAAAPSWAAQAQLPEAASAVQELTGPSKTSLDARNWRLDPAVFTEITPFTAPDIAIQLPVNQREEDPVPTGGPLKEPLQAPGPARP